MEPITKYTSSEGEEMLISEMNQYHLVNALLKVSDVLSLNPNGFGDATEDYAKVKATQKALKEEVIRRLTPAKA